MRVCVCKFECVCSRHHVYASLAALSYGQHVTFTNNNDNEKYTGERLALRATRPLLLLLLLPLSLLVAVTVTVTVAVVALVLT